MWRVTVYFSYREGGTEFQNTNYVMTEDEAKQVLRNLNKDYKKALINRVIYDFRSDIKQVIAK